MELPDGTYWQERGVAIILSGPSGAGKTSVYRRFLERSPEVRFSVSCTTRSPRKGEVDGRDYTFISVEEFRKKIAAGEFLEHAAVHGNLYGTLRDRIEEPLRNGHDVLLDIDVQGARQVKERIAGTQLQKCTSFVFCAPPSFAELERRLRTRGTENEDSIRRRLENARQELTAWREYEYLVVNDNLEAAVEQLDAIVRACHSRIERFQEETGQNG